jgi:hypothetical protein
MVMASPVPAPSRPPSTLAAEASSTSKMASLPPTSATALGSSAGLGSSPPSGNAFASRPPWSDGSVPPTSAPGGQIAHRLAQLAKAALFTEDHAALERWVNGESDGRESAAFTERMRAMARLGEGNIEDALKVLRKTRAQLAPTDHRRRCQTSLALSVALGVAGRTHEAMLEAMDALARAKQTEDPRGVKACLAFLAKLYSAVAREEQAAQLRSASV